MTLSIQVCTGRKFGTLFGALTRPFLLQSTSVHTTYYFYSVYCVCAVKRSSWRKYVLCSNNPLCTFNSILCKQYHITYSGHHPLLKITMKAIEQPFQKSGPFPTCVSIPCSTAGFALACPPATASVPPLPRRSFSSTAAICAGSFDRSLECRGRGL